MVKEELKALNREYRYQSRKLERLSEKLAQLTGKNIKKRKRDRESAGAGGGSRRLTTSVQSLKL
jgi:hypothetical protein